MIKTTESPRTITSITEELGVILDPLVSKLCPSCSKSCCITCGTYSGHFMFDARMIHLEIPSEAQEQLDFLKKSFGWSDDKGFLGEKGCLLPREFRSITCQRSNCEEMNASLSQRDIEHSRDFIRQLKKVRELGRFLT